MIACDCESTGAPEMSRFHQLSAGNTWRAEKSSRTATLSVGGGQGPVMGPGDPDRLEHPNATRSRARPGSIRIPRHMHRIVARKRPLSEHDVPPYGYRVNGRWDLAPRRRLGHNAPLAVGPSPDHQGER